LEKYCLSVAKVSLESRGTCAMRGTAAGWAQMREEHNTNVPKAKTTMNRFM
jgi:hypothetical protein